MDASYTIIWLEFSEKRPEFQYFPIPKDLIFIH